MRSKLFFYILILIIVLSIGYAIGCNELELGQEIDAKIIYFEAKRQPPDISRVEFLITLEETERTMSGANYTISLLVDEKVIDSKTITADENGKVTSAIELTGHGAGMNRMLGALDQEYKDAKSNYDDFMNEIGWDLLRGELFGKSYDEIKKLQEKEKELKTEVNKWKALSQGNGVNWGTALHEFCTKYLTISVEREL